ncbi:hypothetical protein [Micromonospora humi]|uniref:Uncharacterized protein n=1 Tax=Micromonospora humi TaxID=745366 RepID=A0A1C5JVD8_9ACTN|nr:hypothetical protein [Micromonospora humi]SCG74478.1 hypothetical protein GA0070213_114107 [Micromonospora humi]
MAETRAFWLDENVDRERGTGGRGRYEAEVLRRTDEFADTWGDIAPVAFAATAWRVATELSPGYVRRHRRIVAATCAPSPWDGSLICAVTVISRWPAELTWSRQWQRDRGWRDWPQLFGQYTTPTDQDLTRSPHLRATLQVEAPVPLGDLPPAPDGPGDAVAATARRAVVVLTRELNDLLHPLIGQLEAGVPADS